MIGDLPTTRHRMYLAKLKNTREADSGEKDKGGVPARSGSQLQAGIQVLQYLTHKQMAQYTTLFLSIHSVVMTAVAGIMFYLLLTPCGMETEIEGENNIVRNA